MTLTAARAIDPQVGCRAPLFSPKKPNCQIQKDPNAIHSLLVSGKLSELLRFYRSYREPQDVSPTFVYSWIATTKQIDMGKMTCRSAIEDAALAWLSHDIPPEQKKDIIKKIPEDLWPSITSLIPLGRTSSFNSLAQTMADISENGLSISDVFRWKSQEDGLLLFEFKSRTGDSDQTDVPCLPGFGSLSIEYPDVLFVLRTVTMSTEKRGKMQTTLVREVFDVTESGRPYRSVQNFQVQENTVYKQHSLDFSEIPTPTPTANSFLKENRHLFREPCKMAHHRGNTSPSGLEWFPLFNGASADVFCEATENLVAAVSL